MPKLWQRCVTSLSVSSKVPSSSRNSMRSRADILPSLCCRSRRCAPPPSSASWSRFLSSASFCSRLTAENYSGWGWGRRGERSFATEGTEVAQRKCGFSQNATGETSVLHRLFHGRAHGLVAVLFAVPHQDRGHRADAGFFHIDGHV